MYVLFLRANRGWWAGSLFSTRNTRTATREGHHANRDAPKPPEFVCGERPASSYSLVNSILFMEPSVAGVISGVLHHIFIQFPTQAKLFTTLYAYAATNVLFLVLLFTESDALSEGPRLGQIARHVIIFNTFNVFLNGTLVDG